MLEKGESFDGAKAGSGITSMETVGQERVGKVGCTASLALGRGAGC